ncbi:MAG: 8-oxo-dGTP diphosphatase MutT [Betaproteobacteria bacterium]
MEAKRLPVTAGVILRDGQVLLARRGPTGDRAGLWEFPGGKVEAEETAEEALRRELREELAIEVEVGPLLLTVDHDYPDKAIRLLVYACRLVAGEPRPVECAEVRWVDQMELRNYRLAPADEPVAGCLLGRQP